MNKPQPDDKEAPLLEALSRFLEREVRPHVHGLVPAQKPVARNSV